MQRNRKNKLGKSGTQIKDAEERKFASEIEQEYFTTHSRHSTKNITDIFQ